MPDLLETDDRGLYCAAGDFHIDPWRAVDRALITHAHADHARPGCGHYLCAASGGGILRERIGAQATIETLPFGQTSNMNGVKVSFHPAGHILGSAQIRLEHRGEVWVVSGDYKTQADPASERFESVRCHVFISECTFGLPVYHWPAVEEVFRDLNQWCRRNREQGRATVLHGYSLGKAQRLLRGLDREFGPIWVHEAVAAFLPHYRHAGIDLPETITAGPHLKADPQNPPVVVTPPSADPAWLRSLKDAATAFASGWMRIRGTRRWQSMDRGFVLSDHADWAGLNEAIAATQAERVLLTHGYTAVMARWLAEKGFQAETLATHFTGDAGGDESTEGTAGSVRQESVT